MTWALRHRPTGISLGLAVLFRFLWLPALSGAAVALATTSRPAGVLVGCVLFAVELAMFRRRWAWRTLARQPDSERDASAGSDIVRRLARSYASGILLLVVGLSAWQVVTGAEAEHVGRLVGIVTAIILAAAGHVGFEHLVRNPRRSAAALQDEPYLSDEPGLLILLLPVRWRPGIAALFLFVILTGVGAMGIFATAAMWKILPDAPIVIWLSFVMMVAMNSLAGLLASHLEAYHAKRFVGARTNQ